MRGEPLAVEADGDRAPHAAEYLHLGDSRVADELGAQLLGDLAQLEGRSAASDQRV